MPPKRRAKDTEASSSKQEEQARAKKKRVSLACDACRTAREKCDGGRPQCGTCRAQNRHCSYTPPLKKRGVQTGYLRTIELSLAWVFDNVPEAEEAMDHLLTRSEDGKGARALLGKGSGGRHLHLIWNKSRVSKAIGNLLADGQSRNSDDSPDETDQDADNSPSVTSPLRPMRTRAGAINAGEASRSPYSSNAYTFREQTLMLPHNWQQLIDIYVAYTHCWLPIVDPEALRALGSSYPAAGMKINTTVNDYAYSGHAELWSALSIAAFQDGTTSAGSNPAVPSPSQIFDIARSLTPPEDGEFDIHNINAIILHALVLVGRGKMFAASLLVGKAMRLVWRLRSSTANTQEDVTTMQYDTAYMACSILDTLTCTLLGQPVTSFNTAGESVASARTVAFSGFDRPWYLVRDRTDSDAAVSRSAEDPSPRPLCRPIRTLFQLCELTKVLEANLVLKLGTSLLTRQPGPDDLVQKLDSQFNFCNSLISGDSTPKLPSAYLVNILFLASTIELVPEPRSSLLSGFLELVESYFVHFGAQKAPSILVILLQLVQRRGRVGELNDPERSKWYVAMNKLRNIWEQENKVVEVQHPFSAPSAETYTQNPPSNEHTFSPFSSTSRNYDPNPGVWSLRTADAGVGQLTAPKTDAPIPAAYVGGDGNALLSDLPIGISHAPMMHNVSAGRENTQAMNPDNRRMTEMFDYDTIFEQLGSIDYSDNVEVDTRFMTNLGFAPGCDLGEVFNGDFGV